MVLVGEDDNPRDTNSYDCLKSKVSELKREQQNVLLTNRAAKEVGSKPVNAILPSCDLVTG